MSATSETEDEQARLWNGIGGRAWVDAQELLDQMLEPFARLLVDAVPEGAASRVLDIGCGTGATTLAASRRLGAGSRCVGIDISEPMLEAARARAKSDGTAADFIRANAQTHAFEPGSFDRFISRFGVMFFDDPTAAFANLRRAASDGAELRFIAWRSAEENPFMTTAERAAAPLLPSIPQRRSDGPGQFSFANARRVRTFLEQSGWSEIAIAPIDVPCTLPESQLVDYMTRLGPLGRVLHETSDATRRAVIETARAAFDPYVNGAEVRFTAACWVVDARSSKEVTR